MGRARIKTPPVGGAFGPVGWAFDRLTSGARTFIDQQSNRCAGRSVEAEPQWMGERVGAGAGVGTLRL